jgi:hypothetical protein
LRAARGLGRERDLPRRHRWRDAGAPHGAARRVARAAGGERSRRAGRAAGGPRPAAAGARQRRGPAGRRDEVRGGVHVPRGPVARGAAPACAAEFATSCRHAG